jgi:anhydro-N-acetylmuramic acid kinase
MDWFVGLMSGTSMDGIDAALLQTDGESIAKTGHGLTLHYDDAFRARLREVVNGAGDHLALERDLTMLHADAVNALLQQSGMNAADIIAIGFHGHTISHRPADGISWQIGNPALLAEKTGIAVMADFRRADIAAGGQGAPMVPIFHLALAREIKGAVAVVNIGGIANITYIGADKMPESLLAFDTGPGNSLIDRWVQQHGKANYDDGGRIAKSGKVYDNVLAALMEHPFIRQTLPKSCDIKDFSLEKLANLSLADGAATLAEFTAASIASHQQYMPSKPSRWIVCGGGAHNAAIMDGLKKHVSGEVSAAHKTGWAGDLIEAQAFAYLAARSLNGLPLSYPNTTGVSRAVTGGAFYPVASDAN